ncbi:MAG: biotin--[acetyl-CoA-carboxylase] ligase [Terriglobia bacterium]|nr:MAG: biotin--[acetyl-CoA-carboxylase] ligase [Terriglobia bacterium]
MDIERLRRALPQRRIEYYEVVDSTMRAASGLETGSVVLAGEQTAGQGRHGHAWHSEVGSGIYCSLVLQPAPLLTLALGLATAHAIASVTGAACDLRWPNDIMLGERKVAGILVQLVQGAAIAGIGINVNHTSFPAALEAEATSLRLHTGRTWPREELLLALLPAVEMFTRLDAPDILRLFQQASSYAAGRRVQVSQQDGVLEGVTAGLDSAGYLVVRRDDGTDTLIVAGGVRAAGAGCGQ